VASFVCLFFSNIYINFVARPFSDSSALHAIFEGLLQLEIKKSILVGLGKVNLGTFFRDLLHNYN
jgi:hypothetical protein